MLILDRSKNDTSITLDVLRAIAAQAVCVGHAVRFFLVDIERNVHPRPQDLGVQVFFVLSGLLITATLIERSKGPDYSFRIYVIERFARIYSALIPALLFVVLVDGLTLHLTGDSDTYRYLDLRTFLANIVMLQDYKGAFSEYDAMQWSAFGSAAPLWTLAIEWHIYLFVGAIVFIGRGGAATLVLVPLAVIFGQLPSHYLFGALQADGVGHGLFLLWLGGALAYITLQRWDLPLLVSATLFVAASWLWLNHSRSVEYQVTSYPGLVLMVLTIVALSQRTHFLLRWPRSSRIIKCAADYSFTLYLIHYTVMTSMSCLGARGSVALIGSVVASNVIAIALASQTEMKHKAFARLIKSISARTSKFGGELHNRVGASGISEETGTSGHST